MSIPIQNNRKKISGGSCNELPGNEDNELMAILQENVDCNEIKLQLDDEGVKRIIATERIPVNDYINIEKLCRQFANQDVVVKIRNGKKTVIERTRIIQA